MLSNFKLKSLSFNFLYTAFLLFAYNWIFFSRLFELSGSMMMVTGVVLVIFLLLLIASSLVFWRYSTKIFAISLLLINSVCLAFMSIYNISIDKIMLLNAMQTDVSEVGDLMSIKLLTYFIVAGVLPSIIVAKIKIQYCSFGKEVLQRFLLILGCLAIVLALVLPNYKNTAQFLRNNRSLKYQLLPVNYIGAVISAVKIVRQANRQLINIAQDAKFEPYWNNGKKNLFVMVLGETARAQNFSLGGYNRPTNKSLDEFADDIFYFSDVKACGTSTAISLPCIFSKYGRDDFKPGSEAYTENLLDVLQKNGFQTFWSENNSGCKGNCTRIENKATCRNYTCKDDILAEELVDYTKQINQNSFIVLHQQGSHGPAYYKRYSEEFKLFMPTCDTENLDKCTNQEILNSYDNTIAYSSFIIAKVIKHLQELSSQYNVFLLYVSDHGESLGENGIFLHAAPYIIAPDEQIMVPMFFWTNQETAQALKFDTDCLRANLKDAYSHDNIFHTMLGLSGIKTSEYDANLDIIAKCRK